MYTGKEADGNTPRAAEFAILMAKALREGRQALFTEGKQGGISLTKGHFIAYCHATNESVVLLIHVPELRRFDDAAKQSLAEFIWGATVTRARVDFPNATKLAVGVKGVLDYSAIYTGV